VALFHSVPPMSLQVDDPSKYGVIILDEYGRVQQFVEKPKVGGGHLLIPSAWCFHATVKQGCVDRCTFWFVRHHLAVLTDCAQLCKQACTSGRLCCAA
jgi:hypothetical protein